jgi:hypothetical protein
MVIFAATDKVRAVPSPVSDLCLSVITQGNLSPPHGMLPIVLFVTVLGIAACFGMQTGAFLISLDVWDRIGLIVSTYGRLRHQPGS